MNVFCQGYKKIKINSSSSFQEVGKKNPVPQLANEGWFYKSVLPPQTPIYVIHNRQKKLFLSL